MSNIKHLSDQRGKDNTRPWEDSRTRRNAPEKEAPLIKINHEWAARKPATRVCSEVHLVEHPQEATTTANESASKLTEEEEMEVNKDTNLKILPYDPIPWYLVDLKPTQPPPEVKRLDSMPPLEDESDKPVSSSESSDEVESSSSSESEEEQSTGEVTENDDIDEDPYDKADPAYLRQLEAD